ncbi:MAG TPA: hypothetical protein VK835_03085 [Bacteroidia bacterium]|jgi:hypothetical protein|nr:hypothetical protein [Bacteroidia bacterium]
MIDFAIETKVINKFVTKNKQERYLGFIQADKTRSKFIDELSHGQTFEDKLFQVIEGLETDIIKAAFKKLGVKDCYIISENKAIDGQRLGIQETLNNALSPWSDTFTLIVFGDAQIIYREHDGLKNKWISKV